MTDASSHGGARVATLAAPVPSLITIILALMAAVLASASSAAGQVTLTSFSIDGGGNVLSGGALSARCTIGSGIGGTAMVGGNYRATASFLNPTTTGGAVARCPADIDGDGSVTPDDLAEFMGAYFGNPPDLIADFTRDGRVDPEDLADFLNAYFNVQC